MFTDFGEHVEFWVSRFFVYFLVFLAGTFFGYLWHYMSGN